MTAEQVGAQTLARIRAICRALPECTVNGDQHHKISVRGKTLGWHTVDHHGDGRVALTIRLPRGVNLELAELDPQRFFLPPYVARHGYAGIYLDTEMVAWDQVAELLRESYVLVAPAKLRRLVEVPANPS